MVKIKTFQIKNKLGLHARPAAKLVGASSQFESEIFLKRKGQQVDGKSILSVLTLACPRGSWITIRAEGCDAREAVAALGKIIEEKFGED